MAKALVGLECTAFAPPRAPGAVVPLRCNAGLYGVVRLAVLVPDVLRPCEVEPERVAVEPLVRDFLPLEVVLFLEAPFADVSCLGESDFALS
jgi:hypothetical protein